MVDDGDGMARAIPPDSIVVPTAAPGVASAYSR
jgi:hypothetical protein